MNPFGLNILAQYVRDSGALLDWIGRAQPASVVVMDGMALAQQIRQRSPNTLVIYRAYNPNDAHWWTAVTPHDWLAAHIGFAANGVALQVLNEPVLDDAALAWLETLCAICPSHIRLAFPNFAVGNPNEQDIANGKYDRLLRLVCGTRHVLALHEYFRSDPVNEAPFLCGRYGFWLDRADALGLPAPRIVITEHGRDFGGGKNDGWRGQNWSDGYYFSLLAKARTLYGADGIPVCVYCYGTGANHDWASFDVHDAPGLLEKLASYREESAMPEIPAPTEGGVKGAIAGLPPGIVFRNIRVQPVANADDVGDLKVNDVVIAYKDSPADGWVYVERPSDGVKGWVLWSGVQFAPELLPEPGPGEPIIPVPISTYNRMLAALRGVVTDFEELKLPTSGGVF